MEENTKTENWFKRNWKWAVPTGGCLLTILFIIGFAGTMVLGVSSLFTSSEPYKEALTKAQTSQLVIDILGEPIEKDGIAKGSVNYTNGDGYCNLDIPIKGPNGTAIITVIAEKQTDVWNYETLELRVHDTGEIITLLENNEVLDDW
ncbi:cytochrome c oxidase assembly factor Coa1 family protein [Ulvibacter litoralis]|uniref:Cytochrome oxidase complex assembly protein 1 n=1 Tax=Ulvibacter litoralis TaxID=227084 RepID=A0A1G7CX00_9FLAO|nr:cytochrome c oxidase assembly factor Coa1 family protein [Ulvibacter litoralis]GHC45932.1 hypothetical protein GCM10008083_06100 [Ulvibacter litoralis]SDE43186.1 Cytochrome oxidase complex assembly protein 1 [Ulvibacter litoralis]